MRAFLPLLSAIALSSPAAADAPRVVTDVAPVHSLVSRVMQGAGTPDLILPPTASPHGYAMRPSEARAVSQADVVVWVGPALTPWLDTALDSLAGEAERLTLMQLAEIETLPFRTGAAFDAHDHGAHGEAHHAEEHHDDEHHDAEHHDAAHHGDADHAEHDDHGDEHGHDDHAHEGAADPHIWLDPQNARVILTAVAEHLAGVDPANAALYRENAAKGVQEITETQDQIAARMTVLKDRPFIVFHDAYHYFEARFGVEATGAISLADGGAASAGRLAEVRDAIVATGARCALIEPQTRTGLIDAVFADSDIRLEAVNPLGAVDGSKPTSYQAILMQISGALERCLAE